MQKTKSTRGNKTYFTYLVRESYRSPKGPRSRTICNITPLPPAVRELVAKALKGKSFIEADNVELDDALDYGGLAVLADAWERFGMGRLFDGVASPRQRGLIKAMVFARLLFPCAKLALHEQAEGTLLAKACGLDQDEDFDEDDLYEAMDAMNGHWVETEQTLRREAFCDGVDLVLYDLTSTYFDGGGPEGLPWRGAAGFTPSAIHPPRPSARSRRRSPPGNDAHKRRPERNPCRHQPLETLCGPS